jgi:hypothetical protein
MTLLQPLGSCLLSCSLLSGGGSVPIPEPMVFDLVRALGAEKGELEVNVLAGFRWARTGSSKPLGRQRPR